METIPPEMGDIQLEIPTYQGMYYPVQSMYNAYVCDVKRPIKIYSDGIWFNDNALYYALPVLLLQLTLITFVSRVLYFFLRPLKQPRIVSDVLAGVLLGPLGLSRNQDLMARLFPYKSISVLRVLAYHGIIFKLFSMTVKTDPAIIMRSGKKAVMLGLVSLLVPFGIMVGLGYFLIYTGDLHPDVAPDPSIIIMALLISSSSFLVVSEILEEIGLVNTELGRLAMSSSLINNAAGLFAITLYSSINREKPLQSIKSLGLLAAIILFALFIFRPSMRWVVQRTPKSGSIRGGTMVVIMIVVSIAGIISDISGAAFFFGPLLLGLAVPDGPPLGAALVEQIDTVVTEVLMPLVYLSCGLVVEFSEVNDGTTQLPVVRSTLWTVVILAIGILAKLTVTIIPAIYHKISFRNALMLTFMLNFRGMVEIVYLLYYRLDLPNMGVYSVLLLVSIGVTAIIVPLVKTYYDPLEVNYTVGQRTIQHLKPHMELRVVACVQDESPVPTLVSLLEASCAERGNPLCVYVLHLVEQVGRASSSFIAHKNKKGFINPTHMDRLLNAFVNFEQSKKGQVPMQPFTAIAPYKTMHQDICSLAMGKNAAFIIVPFMRDAGENGEADRAYRTIIPNVLSQASCTVGILILKGETVLPNPTNSQLHIGVLFWGGPDDREALSYAACLARHPSVHLTVTRFEAAMDENTDARELAWDDEVVEELKHEQAHNENVVIQEVVIKDMEKTIARIKSIDNQYDLIIVGRSQSSTCLLDQGLAEWSEFPELGLVGDMLCSSDFDGSFSILVVHQHRNA
ncbi:cation/H(+) antiporter 15-like [Phoenix dactylifera]|uniref:Cation/H(+) antiporter 15-like n=1 Tax=Phoenix dactylifera TaxID=42345 RepID=A0A8B7CP82_PHODC|nr:cation/H(+) antiporter 15-like [Phoenix dactylifera]